jgi:hypothetical protein
MLNKHSADNRQPWCLLSPLFIILILFLGACKPRTHYITPPPPPPEVKSKELTEEKAIEIAKNLLTQSRKTVPIQMHYWNTVMTKVACTQYDLDGGVSCSEPVAGAPYGYKNVAQQVQECCKEVDYPLYNSIGTWSAEYSDSQDNWTVKYDFKADNLEYHFVWIVNDNNSQVTEQGLKQS